MGDIFPYFFPYGDCKRWLTAVKSGSLKFGIGWYLLVNSKLWLKKVNIQPNSNPSHSAKNRQASQEGCRFTSSLLLITSKNPLSKKAQISEK